MPQPLFRLNALLTLPFGLAALFAPAKTFASFGITLDAGGSLVARGYAASLIALGLLVLGLRDQRDPAVVDVLLWALLCFNAAESVIQLAAGVTGTATPAVFVTAGVHSVMSVLLLLSLRRARRARRSH